MGQRTRTKIERNQLPAFVDALEPRRLFAAHPAVVSPKAVAPSFSAAILASSSASDHAKFTDADLSIPMGVADIESELALSAGIGFGFLRTANDGSNTSTLIPLSTSAGTHTIDVKVTTPTGVAGNQNDEPIVFDSSSEIDGVPAGVVYSTANGDIVGTGSITDVTYTGQLLESNGAHSRLTGLTGFFANPSFGIRGFDFAAADFRKGLVEIVSTAGPSGDVTFADPNAASNLSPFNVADEAPDSLTAGQLMVAYVRKDASGHAVASDKSYIAIIDSSTGDVVRRITWAGSSRLPYGMVRLDSKYGKYANDIVIADHASGYLRAYTSTGTYVGLLKKKNGTALKLPGVWSLISASTGTDTLYYTQSPTGTSIGRVGVIKFGF